MLKSCFFSVIGCKPTIYTVQKRRKDRKFGFFRQIDRKMYFLETFFLVERFSFFAVPHAGNEGVPVSLLFMGQEKRVSEFKCTFCIKDAM